MIKYYKLADMLNRRGLKMSFLRGALSPTTITKISRGENINTDAINKICYILDCQPGDIMEYEKKGDEKVFSNLDKLRMAFYAGESYIANMSDQEFEQYKNKHCAPITKETTEKGIEEVRKIEKL